MKATSMRKPVPGTRNGRLRRTAERRHRRVIVVFLFMAII
jgi:hypothetical protein